MAPTLHDVITRYTRDNHYVQEATKSKTGRAFRPLEALLGGDVSADAVTPADAVAYQAQLRRDGKSDASINSYTAAVSAVFGFHVRLGILASNPFDGLRKVREQQRDVTFYEQSQIDRLFGAIDAIAWRDPTSQIRLRGILLMGYEAGLRIGEIVNLRWLDIDLDAAVVKIQYRSRKAGQWWEWGTKGFADRNVPMSQELLEHYYRMKVMCPWLYPHLPSQRCKQLQQKAESLPEHTRKRPDNNLHRQLNRIKAYAGVTEGAFHQMRRTAATELSERLQPIDLQRLLGHRSFTTTQRYIGVRVSRYMADARAAMNARHPNT